MRALAEYVMRGRSQAVLVAALATGSFFFSWVGAAVVALVTLRKGAAQSSQVLLWAILPAAIWALMGDLGAITTLLGVMLASVVLRSTTSWPWVLAVAVIFGAGVAVLWLGFGSGYIEEALRVQNELLAQLASGSERQSPLPVVDLSVTQTTGLLGLHAAFAVIMCVILARWWQALLYNAGGFATEFQGLRLPPALTVSLVLSALLLTALGEDYLAWALIPALPFVFSGFALVHGLAARKRIGGNWLGMFYFCWLLFDPLKGLLLVMAAVDSWVDIRGRLDKGQPPE